MKKIALVLLVGMSLFLLGGCNGANNVVTEHVDYRKICYMEDGRYYYLSNIGDKEMMSEYIDSNNMTNDVRQLIMGIKEFPCEAYLKKDMLGKYVEIKIIPKGEVAK